jgi:hypothetical protein
VIGLDLAAETVLGVVFGRAHGFSASHAAV